jgi:hypothetical protein
MKYWLATILLGLHFFSTTAQHLHIADSSGWNVVREGTPLSFKIEHTESSNPKFTLEGVNGMQMQLDSTGKFTWIPTYDLVDRLEKQKEISVIVQAEWADGNRSRMNLNFTLLHQNRPPVIEDLPVFYVKQSSANNYQIPSEYVSDPDGDPLAFKSNRNYQKDCRYPHSVLSHGHLRAINSTT